MNANKESKGEPTFEQRVAQILRAHTTQDGEGCTEFTITPQSCYGDGKFREEHGWWIRVGSPKRPFTELYKGQTIAEAMEFAIHGDRMKRIKELAAKSVPYDKIYAFIKGYLARDGAKCDE